MFSNALIPSFDQLCSSIKRFSEARILSVRTNCPCRIGFRYDGKGFALWHFNVAHNHETIGDLIGHWNTTRIFEECSGNAEIFVIHQKLNVANMMRRHTHQVWRLAWTMITRLDIVTGKKRITRAGIPRGEKACAQLYHSRKVVENREGLSVIGIAMCKLWSRSVRQKPMSENGEDNYLQACGTHLLIPRNLLHNERRDVMHSDQCARNLIPLPSYATDKASRITRGSSVISVKYSHYSVSSLL
ncbi:hypothetical protein TcWFU_007875 [Taenia crassiceps]|uniref:Uncharacterized protein n=1 Tax=Taenia crassiceps TaxID=6207 RepID=A0ABR4QSH4_9CEST